MSTAMIESYFKALESAFDTKYCRPCFSGAEVALPVRYVARPVRTLVALPDRAPVVAKSRAAATPKAKNGVTPTNVGLAEASEEVSRSAPLSPEARMAALRAAKKAKSGVTTAEASVDAEAAAAAKKRAVASEDAEASKSGAVKSMEIDDEADEAEQEEERLLAGDDAVKREKMRKEREVEKRLAKTDNDDDDEEDEIDVGPLRRKNLADKKKHKSGNGNVQSISKFFKRASKDVDKEKGKHDSDSEADAELAMQEAEDPHAHLRDEMYDHSGDHEELTAAQRRKAEKTAAAKKEEEAKRKAEAEGRAYFTPKELERAKLAEYEEMGQGYAEDDDDDDDDETESTMASASVAKGGKKAVVAAKVTTMNTKGNKLAELRAKKMAANKAKPAAAAPATAPAVKKEAAAEEIDDLLPQMYHERCLPVETLAEMQRFLGEKLDEVKKVMPDLDTDKARHYVELQLSKAMMLLESIVNAKDYAQTETEARQPLATFDGKYGDKELLAKHYAKHSMWWKSQHDRAARADQKKARSGDEKAPTNMPSFVRPIDFAYTLEQMKSEENLLPPPCKAYLYHNSLTAFAANDMYKTCLRRFRVTADDVAVMSSNDEPWLCALSGEPIAAGCVVNCLAAAASPVADEAARVEWLRTAVNYGAFAKEGLDVWERFQTSDYARPEMQLAPLVAFYLASEEEAEAVAKEEKKSSNIAMEVEVEAPVVAADATTQPQDDSSAAAAAEPKVVEKNGTASAKRKAPEEAEADDDDGSATTTKRLKPSDGRTKLPFTLEFSYPPPPVNYTRAPCDDLGITLKLKPAGNAREFIATTWKTVDSVAPGVRFLFTDNAVAAMKRADAWLFEKAAFGVHDDEFNEQAEAMLAKLFEKATYDKTTPNTAALLQRKLEAMSEEVFNPRKRRTESKMDKAVFAQWIMFVLATFSHSVEDACLSDKEKTGRERVDPGLQCDTSLRPDEVPFGRHLTFTPFVCQFVRLVLDAVYEHVVVPYAEGMFRDDTKSEYRTTQPLELDGDTLLTALLTRASEEAAQSEAETQERISGAATQWRGKLKKDKEEQKKRLAKAWLALREHVNAFQFDEAVEKLTPTQVFINHLFPRHP